MEDIAILYWIVSAFYAQFARIFSPAFAAMFNIICIGHRFRADEATLEICMDNASCLWSARIRSC